MTGSDELSKNMNVRDLMPEKRDHEVADYLWGVNVKKFLIGSRFKLKEFPRGVPTKLR